MPALPSLPAAVTGRHKAAGVSIPNMGKEQLNGYQCTGQRHAGQNAPAESCIRTGHSSSP